MNSASKSVLISPDYRDQQTKLHEDRDDYGVASVQFAPFVSAIINKTQATELLDYGAGKCRLAPALRVDHKIKVYPYDPAIEKISKAPEPRQMVACIDVLEHIEPDCLDAVLDDLKRVTLEIGYFTVSTVKASKTLSDGRNAHLIVEGQDFWLPKIMSRFKLHSFQDIGNGFKVIVNSKWQ